MGTETWFRNPDNYVKELIEVGQRNIVWDRGLLVKKRIDPDKFSELYFGAAYPWRALVVGEQGTAELGPGFTMAKPKAVYPTWIYGEDAALLEEIISDPVGNHEEYCLDMTVSADERPVWQQEHRVVISSLPPSHTGAGRQILRYLRELQEEHPSCKIHIHGLYSFRIAFGMGFGSADIDARTPAAKGKIVLPSGKEELYENAAKHPHWITNMGYRPVDLAIPRIRCMYNIKSAVWAGENFAKLTNFPTSSAAKAADTSAPAASVIPARGRSAFVGKKPEAKEGDMIACDSCSLSDKCKYVREGAVCSLPGTDESQLARFFKTRDSDTIIDGLGELIKLGATRLERGMENEEVFEELDPEVTKQLNVLFEQGVKLAKLIDPNLRGGAKVQVNVGSGSQVAVGSASPQQFVAAAIRELTAQGIPREKITTEMIQGLLVGMADKAQGGKIIETTAITSSVEVAS